MTFPDAMPRIYYTRWQRLKHALKAARHIRNAWRITSAIDWDTVKSQERERYETLFARLPPETQAVASKYAKTGTPTADESDVLLAAVEVFELEEQFTLIKWWTKANIELVQSKLLQQWAMKNSSYMAARA